MEYLNRGNRQPASQFSQPQFQQPQFTQPNLTPHTQAIRHGGDQIGHALNELSQAMIQSHGQTTAQIRALTARIKALQDAASNRRDLR